MRISFSPKSISDLDYIQDYVLESFGVRVAERVISSIEKDIAYLLENPFFGRHIVDGIRKLVSGVSIVIYEVQDEKVEIHHVIDSRTDWVRTLNLDK